MQKITPFLWFDNNAEEAMNFYISVFKDAKIVNVNKLENVGPTPGDSIITGTFQLFGQDFMVINGGPMFKFTEAISLFVSCETQEEIDTYWSKLTADGGQESQCGWLKDKFGLSWQIVPASLNKILGNKENGKGHRAMQALMKMKKLDIKALEEA